MDISDIKKVLKFSVKLKLASSLLLRSGNQGEFVDSTVERTSDGKLHINGYVWASLLRRALSRIKGTEDIVDSIGKYDGTLGVSCLWCESSFVELPGKDIHPVLDTSPGIRIKRKWGAVDIGALFYDEVVPPGLELTMNFNFFCHDSQFEFVKNHLISALWVIDQGIETIGGGWSYGHGKLKVESIKCKQIELSGNTKTGINQLWEFNLFDENNTLNLQSETPQISKPWIVISVDSQIVNGQFLAVHTRNILFDAVDTYAELPESFIFRRYRFTEDNKMETEIIIPGRTIRQALLSTPIERKLRTIGTPVCTDHAIQDKKPCLICRWFGSTDWGGVISVSDAPVKNDKTVILNRIHLCEHSMQNINLFSGEYLSKGNFSFKILLDSSRGAESCNYLLKELSLLLNEMIKNDNRPPGWHRIGATSTCTGQVQINNFDIKEIGADSE